MTEEPSTLTIRDIGPYSTRNTAKGALIAEVGHVFVAIRDGTTLEDVREGVLSGALVPQRSRNSRKGIWDHETPTNNTFSQETSGPTESGRGQFQTVSWKSPPRDRGIASVERGRRCK
jgi:hypothetical protein